jgi:hypothetical protein
MEPLIHLRLNLPNLNSQSLPRRKPFRIQNPKSKIQNGITGVSGGSHHDNYKIYQAKRLSDRPSAEKLISTAVIIYIGTLIATPASPFYKELIC